MFPPKKQLHIILLITQAVHGGTLTAVATISTGYQLLRMTTAIKFSRTTAETAERNNCAFLLLETQQIWV